MSKTGHKVIEEARKLLSTIRAFEKLSILSREVLAESAVIQKIHSDQFLWEYGDSSEFFACVVSGLIEISRPTPQGKEHAMGLFGPGDLIGMSAFLKKVSFPGSAKSISPSTTVLKFYIRHQISNDNIQTEEISTWIREMFLLHEQILRDKIDILTAETIEYRIFEFLLHLRRRFGVTEGRTKVTIPLSITKTQISKIIDARSETVFRTLTGWKKSGFIEWLPGKIIVHGFEQLEQHIQKPKKERVGKKA